MKSVLRVAVAILAVTLTLLSMTGCATFEPIPVEPGLWQQKHMRIGVVMTHPPSAGAFKAGAQGLLDLAINESMASDLEKHLASLEPRRFTVVATQFEGRLRQMGFPVVHIDESIDPERLPERAEKKPRFYDRDIGALASTKQIDALLLLKVDGWGTTRSYYGFIPLGAPTATFHATAQLIGRDGRLLWQARFTNLKQDVGGEWDQAPDFPNLTRSIEVAEDDAVAFFEKDFFQTAPPPASPPPAPSPPVVSLR
jgi:hypothetical protein